MTRLQLTVLFLTVATAAWAAAIAAPPSMTSVTPSPERIVANHRRDLPVDNAVSTELDSINAALANNATTSALDKPSALDKISAALLNLAYIDTVPFGEITCRPTDPSNHQLARADAVFRKGIPHLAAGRRDSCDVVPAAGRCEHLWCGSNSGIYLCPRRNENRIRFSCTEAALYALAAAAECGGGKGLMGRTWDREGRFTVEVWGGRCAK